MPRPKIRIVAASLAAFASMAGAQAQSPYGIGRVATPAEIAGWNIDIGRDGSGLPPGSGTVSHGREVFEQQCAACHGRQESGLHERLLSELAAAAFFTGTARPT